MAKINQLVDGVPSGKVTLDKPAFRIGRAADNDLQLSDAAASSHHAVIESTDEKGGGPPAWRVRDLGSTNGTFVNDERMEQASLKDGDVVRIGVTNFRFSYGSGGDHDRTKVIKKTWIPGLIYMK